MSKGQVFFMGCSEREEREQVAPAAELPKTARKRKADQCARWVPTLRCCSLAAAALAAAALAAAAMAAVALAVAAMAALLLGLSHCSSCPAALLL